MGPGVEVPGLTVPGLTVPSDRCDWKVRNAIVRPGRSDDVPEGW